MRLGRVRAEGKRRPHLSHPPKAKGGPPRTFKKAVLRVEYRSRKSEIRPWFVSTNSGSDRGGRSAAFQQKILEEPSVRLVTSARIPLHSLHLKPVTAGALQGPQRKEGFYEKRTVSRNSCL